MSLVFNCPTKWGQGHFFHADRHGMPRFCAILSNTLGWKIKVYFDRERLTIKVVHNVEYSEVATINHAIMHEINRPTPVQRFRRSYW